MALVLSEIGCRTAGAIRTWGWELYSIGVFRCAPHMVLHESLCPFRQTVHLDGPRELASDLGRHVPARSIQSVERHDPDRTAVAADDHVADDREPIGFTRIGLDKLLAAWSEIAKHQMHDMIGGRNDGWRHRALRGWATPSLTRWAG